MSDFGEMTIDELWTEMESADGFHKGQILLALFNRKYELEEYGLALAYASEAAEIFRGTDSQRELGMAQVFMGNCHHAVDAYAEAIECYKNAGVASIGCATDHDLAVLQENLANSLLENLDFEGALKGYEAAETLYLSVDLKVEAARCTLEAGDIHFQFGRDFEALAAYMRAREQVAGCCDLLKVSKTEANIAEAYMALGEYDHALVHAREALNMAKTCPCPTCINRSQLRLGKALRLVGQTVAAKEYIQKSFDSYHENNHPSGQGMCLIELGNLAIVDEPEKARDYFEQARSIFTGLDWHVYRDKSIAGLATLAANAGDYQSAIELVEEIVTRAKDGMKIGFANANRLTLAEYHLAHDDPFRAISTLGTLTEVGRITQAEMLRQLSIKAEAYMKLRNWDEAIAAANEGLDMIIPGDTGAIEGLFHQVRGECLRHKDPIVAEREYAKAISFYISDGQVERAEELAKEHFVAPAKLVYDLELHESTRNKLSQ